MFWSSKSGYNTAIDMWVSKIVEETKAGRISWRLILNKYNTSTKEEYRTTYKGVEFTLKAYARTEVREVFPDKYGPRLDFMSHEVHGSKVDWLLNFVVKQYLEGPQDHPSS